MGNSAGTSFAITLQYEQTCVLDRDILVLLISDRQAPRWHRYVVYEEVKVMKMFEYREMCFLRQCRVITSETSELYFSEPLSSHVQLYVDEQLSIPLYLYLYISPSNRAFVSCPPHQT